MSDIFEKIIAGDYSRPEINQAITQVPNNNLSSLLAYLFDCQLVTDVNIRRYARALALRIPVEKLAVELKTLMVKQKSGEPETINLSRVLALRILPADLSLQLEFLLNCQREQDSNVVNLSRELALLIPRNLLAPKLTLLLAHQASGYINSRNLAAFLAIKVMQVWSPARLAPQLEYLITCQDLTDDQVRVTARELALNISIENIDNRLQRIDLTLVGVEARGLVQDLFAKVEDAKVGIRSGKVSEIKALIVNQGP